MWYDLNDFKIFCSTNTLDDQNQSNHTIIAIFLTVEKLQ